MGVPSRERDLWELKMASAGTQKDLFAEAVSCVFREWQALRIIVDNMFGGPHTKEKAQWLEEVTTGFVSSNGASNNYERDTNNFNSRIDTTIADLQHWELEDYLATVMDQEFRTTIDDASLPCVINSTTPERFLPFLNLDSQKNLRPLQQVHQRKG